MYFFTSKTNDELTPLRITEPNPTSVELRLQQRAANTTVTSHSSSIKMFTMATLAGCISTITASLYIGSNGHNNAMVIYLTCSSIFTALSTAGSIVSCAKYRNNQQKQLSIQNHLAQMDDIEGRTTISPRGI